MIEADPDDADLLYWYFDRPEWHHRAACHGMTDLFYSTTASAKEQARRICASCPVNDECLEAGMSRYEFGVWGGSTFGERKQMRRRTGQARPSRWQEIKHGTPAGRNAHRRRGEPVCQECAAGYRQYQRTLAARRKESAA